MRFFYLLLFITSSVTVRGQTPDSTRAISSEGEWRVPHLLLKLSLLSPVDIDATVQGAAEVRTGRRTSVQAEFGYGWPGFAPVPWAQPGRNHSQKEVWRGRLEARLYRHLLRPPRRRYRVPTTFPIGRYWAFETAYKQLNALVSREIAVGCPTGRCPPPGEIFTRFARRQVVATHLKIGYQWPTARTDKGWSRLLLDSYIGVGARFIWISQPTPFPAGSDVLRPRPVFDIQTAFYGFNPGLAELIPSVAIGFKLIYLF